MHVLRRETDIANQAVTSAKIANGTIGRRHQAERHHLGRSRTRRSSCPTCAASLQDSLEARSQPDRLEGQRFCRGVVGATCPPAALRCGQLRVDNASGSRNFGVLYGCTLRNGGAVALTKRELHPAFPFARHRPGRLPRPGP
jgi:hypothetical protein